MLYKYRKRNNNDAKKRAWQGNSGHLPPRKFDNRCNLVSSEVLLKLCFIEFNYYKTKNSNTAAHLLCVFRSVLPRKILKMVQFGNTYAKFSLK